MRGSWFALVILALAAGLHGCRAGPASATRTAKTEVRGTVTDLARAENGAFRYYGKIRLESPARYRRKEVGLFVISHERDAREFSGKTVSAVLDDDDLSRSIEPSPDPFSVARPEPHLSLEYAGGSFAPIDYVRYAKPVAVRGVISAFQTEKDKDAMYFMFDMAFSGDWASVEIVEPAIYRGLIIHVLVYDSPRVGRAGRVGWSRIGAKVAFTVSESVLAWEPWGFVPIDDLADVRLQADPVSAAR